MRVSTGLGVILLALNGVRPETTSYHPTTGMPVTQESATDLAGDGFTSMDATNSSQAAPVPPKPPGRTAEFRTSLQIQKFASAVTALLGVPGNLLCIVVLTRKRPLSSTSLYLVNLAVADFGIILLTQVVRVLPRGFLGLDVVTLHPWACKLWFYLNYVMHDMSGWTLVAVTVERTVVVYLPLKAKSLCTRQTAFRVLIILNLACTLLPVFYLASYGPVYASVGGRRVQKAACTMASTTPWLRFYMRQVRVWQEFVLSSLLPFLILMVCNVLISTRLVLESRKRRQVAQGGDDANLTSLTVMLLTVSVVYLACTLPLRILYLIDKSPPFGRRIPPGVSKGIYYRWSFATTLKNLNHAINFLLYLLSGRHFRQTLLAVMGCRACLHRHGDREADTASTQT